MSKISATDLQHLHELYVQYEETKEKLNRGPNQVRMRRNQVEKKRNELEACRQQLLQIRKTIDEKNLQLKTNEAKIAELRVKLNQASSNREYDIIQTQIDADIMANSVLEDEIIELLEKVDVLKKKCGELESEWKRAEADAKEFEQRVAAEEPELKRRLEQLHEEIAEAEKAIPSEVADDYRRLVARYGATALAPIMGDACSQCFFSLSPQLFIDVRAGRLVFCRNCGRLLYAPQR